MNEFWKRITRTGLTRQVLVGCLLLSLAPLCIVSWLSYREAYNQLYQYAEKLIYDVSAIQIRTINDNFKRMEIDLVQESDRRANIRFLSALKEGVKKSDKKASEFVESYQWEVIKGKESSDLTTFWKEHEYYDIFLIDTNGNILFTVARENDLGKNLFKGSLGNSRFSLAVKKSFESGKAVFSDLEKYSLKKDILSGFMVSPVIDESGNKIGLMAFQVAGEYLSQLLALENETRQSSFHYLIGPDLSLRSPGSLGKEYPVLEKPVKTDVTKQWRDAHVAGHGRPDVKDARVKFYKGPHGNEVFGMHTEIRLPGVHWAYISEIDADKALSAPRSLARLTLILIGIMALLVIFFTVWGTQRIIRPITEISRALRRVGKGDFLQQINIKAEHELGNLVHGFNSMMENLKVSKKNTHEQNWLQEGINQLSDNMQGDQELDELARNVISFLCRYLDAQTGAYYVVREKKIKLTGSYAFSTRKGFKNEFSFGEGVVGQAVLEKQTLEISDVPEDYLAISSGLGETVPRHISVVPLIWNNKVSLVLEFCTLKPFSLLHKKFIKSVSPAVSVAAQTAISMDQTRDLLEKTQVQAEELQAREEELRDSNRLLEEQARDLKQSQKILQNSQSQLEQKNEQLNAQQEELRVTNEELEEQAQDLKNSQYQLDTKNRELEAAQSKLEQRAQQLSISSKYKSEFLANMSHELRTPLNSILILAKLLADNQDGNLSEKQVEFSGTIYDSGKELLNLINEILDLSKIEAGKMETHIDVISLKDFIDDLKRKFNPLALQKELAFTIETSEAPDEWQSDRQKLGQIVKNLLSNAFKFTSSGHVKVTIGIPVTDTKFITPKLKATDALVISVLDSGIGIPEAGKDLIFEAFQQVDGTTSRKYGGTGLGLTISRELARLLGGDLQVESKEGVGSTFTLYIRRKAFDSQRKKESAPLVENNQNKRGKDLLADPMKEAAPVHASNRDKSGQSGQDKTPGMADKAGQHPPNMEKEFTDDRTNIKPGDRSILIIEDDRRFVKIIADLAKTRGFKTLVAEDGEEGLHLADFYQPSGIILDIGLPGKNGWEVMDHLKDHSKTRHIPVHFMTANDFSNEGFKKGAVGFLTKPVTLEGMQEAFSRIETIIDASMKHLLIVEDDPNQQKALCALLDGQDIHIEMVSNGDDAKKRVAEQDFDCIILDYGLPDMSGLQLIEALHKEKESVRRVPVIVYTGRDLEPRERAMLDKYSNSCILKSVHSEERLLDDTTLFLHRVETALPKAQQKVLRMLHDRESIFEGRKVLITDDDMRNVFALSAILQEQQMQVIAAKNGIEALKKLAAEPDVAIVLMDIMMPEMDGYEATRKIRSQERFRKLPIIALTAKAMKGDRAKCIEAGASDYLAKPVDTDKLLSMMRVWLYQK